MLYVILCQKHESTRRVLDPLKRGLPSFLFKVITCNLLRLREPRLSPPSTCTSFVRSSRVFEHALSFAEIAQPPPFLPHDLHLSPVKSFVLARKSSGERTSVRRPSSDLCLVQLQSRRFVGRRRRRGILFDSSLALSSAACRVRVNSEEIYYSILGAILFGSIVTKRL